MAVPFMENHSELFCELVRDVADQAGRKDAGAAEPEHVADKFYTFLHKISSWCN